MNNLKSDDDAIYEEWIAHPDRREYAPLKDHDKWVSKKGWWASGWRGNRLDALRLRNTARAATQETADDSTPNEAA